MNEDKRVIVLGNVFPSKGQNGDVFETRGLSPCLRSGQGIKGRGIGSCNAPKVIEYEGQDNKPVKRQDEQVMVL